MATRQSSLNFVNGVGAQCGIRECVRLIFRYIILFTLLYRLYGLTTYRVGLTDRVRGNSDCKLDGHVALLLITNLHVQSHHTVLLCITLGNRTANIT